MRDGRLVPRRAFGYGRLPAAMTASADSLVNAFSVDVEDWYQVADFDAVVPFDTWDRYESRVRRNTDKILQLLEEFGLHPLAAAQPSSLAPLSIYNSSVGAQSYGKRTEPEAAADAPSSMEAVTHSLVPPLMKSALARKITGWAFAAVVMCSLLLIAFWTEVDSARPSPQTVRAAEKTGSVEARWSGAHRRRRGLHRRQRDRTGSHPR